MEIIKDTKHLLFIQMDRDKDRKTEVIVVNNKHNATIGVIKWYSNWRQYCFFPYNETIWNIDCLISINEVIMNMTNSKNKKKLEKI